MACIYRGYSHNKDSNSEGSLYKDPIVTRAKEECKCGYARSVQRCFRCLAILTPLSLKGLSVFEGLDGPAVDAR